MIMIGVRLQRIIKIKSIVLFSAAEVLIVVLIHL
jgi:hypothetical protein